MSCSNYQAHFYKKDICKECLYPKSVHPDQGGSEDASKVVKPRGKIQVNSPVSTSAGAGFSSSSSSSSGGLKNNSNFAAINALATGSVAGTSAFGRERSNTTPVSLPLNKGPCSKFCPHFYKKTCNECGVAKEEHSAEAIAAYNAAVAKSASSSSSSSSSVSAATPAPKARAIQELASTSAPSKPVVVNRAAASTSSVPSSPPSTSSTASSAPKPAAASSAFSAAGRPAPKTVPAIKVAACNIFGAHAFKPIMCRNCNLPLSDHSAEAKEAGKAAARAGITGNTSSSSSSATVGRAASQSVSVAAARFTQAQAPAAKPTGPAQKIDLNTLVKITKGSTTVGANGIVPLAGDAVDVETAAKQAGDASKSKPAAVSTAGNGVNQAKSSPTNKSDASPSPSNKSADAPTSSAAPSAVSELVYEVDHHWVDPLGPAPPEAGDKTNGTEEKTEAEKEKEKEKEKEEKVVEKPKEEERKEEPKTVSVPVTEEAKPAEEAKTEEVPVVAASTESPAELVVAAAE